MDRILIAAALLCAAVGVVPVQHLGALAVVGLIAAVVWAATAPAHRNADGVITTSAPSTGRPGRDAPRPAPVAPVLLLSKMRR